MDNLFGNRSTVWFCLALAALIHAPAAWGQSTQTVRVVAYNTQDDVSSPTPAGALPYLATVLEGIGQQKYVGDGVLQLPDIIGLEETTSNSTSVTPLVSDLNSYYGSNIYSSSTYQATDADGNTDGDGPNAVIYNQNTLNLVASVGVGTPTGDTNGVFRQPVRYEFQPLVDKGTNNGVFYVYVDHYKSGSAGTGVGSNGYYRNLEAQAIRNDEAANLPANASVLYVGDYNLDGSTEAMYQTLTATKSPSGVSQGAGIDPLNPSNDYTQNWANNSSYTYLMTEHDTDLEYRDDLELMTSNVYNDAAGTLDYLANSFHAFGNNGTVAYEGNVDTLPGNTAVNDIIGNGSLTPSEVLSAENGSLGSDHLPVVADYTINVPEPVALSPILGILLLLIRVRRCGSKRLLRS